MRDYGVDGDKPSLDWRQLIAFKGRIRFLTA